MGLNLILQWLQKYVITKAGEARDSRTTLCIFYTITIYYTSTETTFDIKHALYDDIAKIYVRPKYIIYCEELRKPALNQLTSPCMMLSCHPYHAITQSHEICIL